MSARRFAIHVRRETLEGIVAFNAPAQPVCLRCPPDHFHAAEEVGGLVKLFPGLGQVALPVQNFSVAEVEIDLFEKARMGAEKILSNP